MLARRFDDALRPIGSTAASQFPLLMSLDRPQPPNMKDVASLLAMDRTTLTANLKPLERRNLVKVKLDKADKRGRRLILTAAGRALLAAAAPIWTRTHAETERSLTQSSADTLRAPPCANSTGHVAPMLRLGPSMTPWSNVRKSVTTDLIDRLVR